MFQAPYDFVDTEQYNLTACGIPEAEGTMLFAIVLEFSC